MQRISKKKLFWLILLMILVGFSDLWVSASIASSGSAEIEVSVKGTYLRTDPDQASQAASSVDSPGIVDLQSNGFSEGDTIRISFQGSFDRYGQSNYETLDYLIGVFSSTNQLLSIYDANRVPDAIEAGEDFETGETWFTRQNTDISEDFEISPSTGFSIEVPENAKYLFVSLYDSYYPDNTAPSSIKVTLSTRANGFPFEYLLVALGVIALIGVLIFFVVFKRRKKEQDNDQ